MIRVENIETPNGNKAVNQFHIEITGYSVDIFQSYSTTIAVHDRKNNIMFINKDYYKYSRTTSKYYNIWLNDYVFQTKFSGRDYAEYQLLSDDQFTTAVLKMINDRMKN